MKYACKRNMDRFVALDEEGQKDFLLFMLDAMDEIEAAIESEEDEEEKEIKKRYFIFYQTMVPFFLDDPEWMKEIGFSAVGFHRRYAKYKRNEWERKRKESEA